MNKGIISLLLIIAGYAASGQGIGIQLKNSGGTYAHILRDGVQMKVTDSLGNIRLSTAITGIDTTNARVSRLINLFPTSLLNGRFRVVDTTANDLLTVANSRITSTNTALDTTNARLSRLLDRFPASLLTGKLSVIDTTGNFALSDIITHTSSTATNCVEINTNTTGLVQEIDTLTRKIDSLRTFLDVDSIRVWATNGFGSGGGGGGGSGLANYKLYDTMRANTSLNVDSLNSLANSATAGWLSARVDNTSNLYPDYKIYVKLSMANTAPANDRMAYVYIVPWYYDGSAFNASSNGTATLPFDVQRRQTFAQPNNYRLLGVLAYTTQNMVLQDSWSLSSIFGDAIPDAFSIYIINFTGAAVNASSNVVAYRALQKVYK